MTGDIRPATVADLGEVKSVATASWYAAHEAIVGTETVEQFLEEYYDESALRESLADEHVFAVATTADDTVVGFADSLPLPDAGDYSLARLYVHPDRWGEGIGRQLLTYTETVVRERGGETLSLHVMAENDRAVRFYETAGFDRVDEQYNDTVDTTDYVYEKDLVEGGSDR